MDDLKNVSKKDPQIRNKIKNMLDRYNRLPYKYQSQLGWESLIQNIIPKELIKLMGTTITDIDIELKMKICKIEHIEIRLLNADEYMYNK